MNALQRYIKNAYKGNITDFAEALGVSRYTVHAWISGRRSPNRLHLMLLHTKTGIPFATLLGQLAENGGRRR